MCFFFLYKLLLTEEEIKIKTEVWLEENREYLIKMKGKVVAFIYYCYYCSGKLCREKFLKKGRRKGREGDEFIAVG